MSSDLGSYHNKDQADEEENEDSQQFHFSVVNRVDLVELKTELNVKRWQKRPCSSHTSY
jgi:hypothetical protein